MPKPNLDNLIDLAYTDKKVYEHLKKNHYLQWQKIVTKIVNEHFDNLTKEVKKEKQ
jgi:hypothetical protein